MSQRGQWSTKMGFVFAAAGSAVGLGNIWKFPYITGENGGGVFVLIYLFCILVIGMPIMISEFIIGRGSSKSPVGAFKTLSGQDTKWALGGWLGVITGFIILSYYSVVAGWAMHYSYLSITDQFFGKEPAQIENIFDTLYASPGPNLFWHITFMLLTVGIVIGGIKRGIEKWSKVLMPVLLVILGVLLIYSVFSDGFGRCLDFVFAPHIEKVSPSSVLEALGHAFFTLSLGMGAMITYGSYLDKKADLPKSALIVSGLDTLIALMACLVIFSIIFSHNMDPAGGPGLVFKTLPIVFSSIKGGQILAILFFVLLIVAALTSAISLLEVVTSYFIDERGWPRIKATLVTGLTITLLGIPCAISGWWGTFLFEKNFFDLLDHVASNWFLPLGGLFISLYVGWVLDHKVKNQEFIANSWLAFLFKWWLQLVRYFCPVAVLMIFLYKLGVF